MICFLFFVVSVWIYCINVLSKIFKEDSYFDYEYNKSKYLNNTLLKFEGKNMEDEKTPGKASTRAKNKYNAKAYDQFLITVPTGHKDLISAAAKEQGYSSRNEFIVTAINEKIQHYNTDKA